MNSTHLTPQTESTHKPVVAALYMLGAIISFSAMAIAGRAIYAELDTFELMTYRSLVGVVIVTILIARSRAGFSHLRTLRPGLHAMRNIFHFAGQNLWFYAVAVIPLAQLVALEFTSPLWVALLAPWLLGEKLNRRKLLSIGIGFIGVLIVSRPGLIAFETGHFAILAAALGFAMSVILTRRLSRSESTLCILFWMSLSQMLMGAALAAPGGISLFSLSLAPYIAIVGICGITAQYCLTSALHAAPATVVGPMEFGRLPLIAVIGVLMYGEPLELAVIAGSLVIFGANLLNLRKE